MPLKIKPFKKDLEKESDSKFKKFLNKLVYIIGILGPLWAIPQIVKIWQLQNSAGIALITWIAYFFGAIILFMYAFLHKEKPLVIMYGGWIIIDLGLIISIAIFR